MKIDYINICIFSINLVKLIKKFDLKQLYELIY
jgi:hypothetical protein